MSSYLKNTLRYDPELCAECWLCTVVCPHRVFERGDGSALLAHPERCIECGACSMNCEPKAIEVESGVGCAAALFGAALLGREPTCCCVGEDRGSAARPGRGSCCPERADDEAHEEESRCGC